MIVKILNNKKLIEDACILLHEVYIEHGQWKFDPANPSNLRVEKKRGRNLLVNDFIYKATWFGAFDNNDILLGCICVNGMDENDKFEIERYQNSEVVWSYLTKQRKSCVELMKLAVKPDYARKGVIDKLLLAVFQYCEKNKLSVFTCTQNSYLKSFYEKMEFPLIIEQAFRYKPQDSTLVTFYFADYTKEEINNIISNLKYFSSNNAANKKYNILELLDIIAPILPVPVYWHDTTGVVLGINDQCLKAIGASRKIVGKRPYDFYPKDVADHILEHNKVVMKTEQILSQEEKIEDITTKQVKYFAAVKAPLYDDSGKIIGIVGTSLDITAEKEAEKLKIENLRLENLAKQTIIDGTNNFRQFLNKIVSEIQNFRIEDLSEKLGIKSQIKQDEIIRLTKRENEVLYFLSLNKSPKDIATIITVLENKPVTDSTINALINKKLYPKLGVFNVGQLIEKANILNLIPFLPDN